MGTTVISNQEKLFKWVIRLVVFLKLICVFGSYVLENNIFSWVLENNIF